MISLEWVSDYIDISDQDLKELAVKITQSGINVEKVITNHIDNLVIGKVISCVDHPDSDHLHVCMVDVGKSEAIQIVCGAPNVREGLKVIVSLPGAVLPGNFEIKKGKIRGVESNGMICALYELGLEEKNDETYAKGIEELNSDAKVGEDPIKYLGLDDTLYELDIHKHRNNDCYYHIGFAYEIGAILNRRVVLPQDSFKEVNDSINNHFNLDVETEKCPYYTARMVRNIKIKESPDFIKRRLIRAGMRPINNVVDISNYVMLEYGQPLHFFDKKKLGDKVLVRDAKEGEKVITLDGKERILSSADIVITDGEKPVCVAGVMGGENTEVDDNTTDILIEAAIFDPVSIRYTAAKLDLRSEASIRYGKGLNFEYTDKALKRACHLLEKYADAEILTDIVKHDKVDKTIKTVEFSPDDINKLLGIKIDEEDMKVELGRLDFAYEYKDRKFTVTIPRRRLDISIKEDLIEEVGRIYGVDKIEAKVQVAPIKKGSYDKTTREIRHKMMDLGLNETLSYVLVNEQEAKTFTNDSSVEAIKLLAPLTEDRSTLRCSILSSLYKIYQYNVTHYNKNVSVFEIGKTFYKKQEEYKEENKLACLMTGDFYYGINTRKQVDFYIIKGIAEELLYFLGYEGRYSFVVNENLPAELHPGESVFITVNNDTIGIIGKLNPKFEKEPVYVLEINLDKLLAKKTGKMKYKEISKFPTVKKDLSIIVDNKVQSSEIATQIKKAAGSLLLNSEVFDVYAGKGIEEGKKSLAFALTFGANDRTLTNQEINDVLEKVVDRLSKIGEIRQK